MASEGLGNDRPIPTPQPLPTSPHPDRRYSDDISSVASPSSSQFSQVSRYTSASSSLSGWRSPLARIARILPPRNATKGAAGQAPRYSGRNMAMNDSQGVDLDALQGRPAYHHSDADSSSRRLPFHGNDSFPPTPYDDSFQARIDSNAKLLSNAQRRPTSSPRSVSFAPTTSRYSFLGGPPRDPNGPSRSWSCKPRWHSSFSMYLSFLFGLLCAIGHHIFYHYLDGEPAVSQSQMLRYGTFLAYGAKAGFSAAVVSALKQRVWVTVRTRFMSVTALDSMFAAAEDMVAMFDWEFLSGAKAAFALALFAWTTPLVVILTANTLLVEPRTMNHTTTCPGVRSLNFAFEDTNDWRLPTEIDGLFEIPVSIWNTTKRDANDTEGWFDYYTGPSPNFQQTATLGAFLQEVVARKNASMEVCGTGWNCTFTIDFTAPGYKCKEVASGVGSKPANFTQESGEAVPPFDTGILLPKGNFTYYAFNSGGEYSTTQLKNVSIGGIPNMDRPYPPTLGALRTEPIIWIGYTVMNDPDLPQPANRSDDGWDAAFTPKMFACEHRETAYTANLTYSDGTQFASITNRTFGVPVINTTFLPHVDAQDGTEDNITAVPRDNYVYPNDTARYRRAAAYHSLGFMVRKFLNGTVEVEDTLINPIQNTEAIQTKLLDQRSNYFPYPNLMDMVQDFYEDIILSIFSNPQFAEVVWAAKPGEQSGTLREGGGVGGGTTTTTQQQQQQQQGNSSDYLYACTKSRTANVYDYHAHDLWIVYGICVALTLLSLGAGALAIRENGGVTRNTRFSSIVAATRGPALERIPWQGPLLDKGDVPADLKGLRLGYGVMGGGGGGIGIGGEGPPVGLDGRDIGLDENLERPGVGDTEEDAGAGQEPVWRPDEVRCGFGLEGDVSQRRKEGSLFHR